MVVYADILIILNLTVDYMLLLVTGKILKLKPSVIRQTAAAAIGGIPLHICARSRHFYRNTCKNRSMRFNGFYSVWL